MNINLALVIKLYELGSTLTVNTTKRELLDSAGVLTEGLDNSVKSALYSLIDKALDKVILVEDCDDLTTSNKLNTIFQDEQEGVTPDSSSMIAQYVPVAYSPYHFKEVRELYAKGVQPLNSDFSVAYQLVLIACNSPKLLIGVSPTLFLKAISTVIKNGSLDWLTIDAIDYYNKLSKKYI